MSDAEPLRKVARQIQQKAAVLGVVCVALDEERRVHVIPGSTLEPVGVYLQGITIDQIVDDLEFTQAVV